MAWGKIRLAAGFFIQATIEIYAVGGEFHRCPGPVPCYFGAVAGATAFDTEAKRAADFAPWGIMGADMSTMPNMPVVSVAAAAIAGFWCGWAMHCLTALLQPRTSCDSKPLRHTKEKES